MDQVNKVGKYSKNECSMQGYLKRNIPMEQIFFLFKK